MKLKLLTFISILALAGPALAARLVETDICVYGGAAGGVTAAVQAKRMGKSVSLVVINHHLGGLTSGGLGDTDIGKNGDSYIQGMAREFYGRIATKYGLSGAKFTFEPKVAEAVFNELVAEAEVPVYWNRHLQSVNLDGTRIREIVTQDGDVFRAKIFIDASYEGDLLAKAGVSFTSGREANSQYGETINGIQTVTSGNQLPNNIDPYIVAGNPASGLLPGVNPAPAGPNGAADSLIQAYCYRMCLTNVPANRIMIEQPAGYNEADYEILFRAIEAGQTGQFWKTAAMPNGKTDSNNASGISCDYISGRTADWIEADFATRQQLAAEHEKWQRGLVWTVQNHPRVPQAIRTTWSQWGLPKDEFTDTNHWPHQLYIREARRMVSDYVMTEKNCLGTVVATDPIALGAYTMDSHNCQRIVLNGMVKNEGDIQRPVNAPYPISYRSIVPKAGECPNLLVPWSLSATHISFGSIRMEPVFMNLGQAAATAAAFAIDGGTSVQDVPYPKLKAQLLADKQRLAMAETEDMGIVVDNADASGFAVTGAWTAGSSTAGYYGADYLHDGDARNGSCTAVFTPDLPQAGDYRVELRWPSHANRATNVPVQIVHNGGTAAKTVNQRINGGQWYSLGTYTFSAGKTGSVKLSDSGTDGYVIADAVRLVKSDSLPEVSVWETNARAAEPAAPGEITFSRNGPTADPLVISLAISGTATPGADYQILPPTVTIPAGAANVSLTITPVADNLAEGPETVEIQLSAGQGYAIASLGHAVIAIQDEPFDGWRHESFNAADRDDDAISGPAADPDLDGTSNLLEFLAGRNPLAADGPPDVRLDFADGLALEMQCVGDASQLKVRVERSANLDAWQTVENNLPQEILPADEPFRRLRFPVGEALAGRSFYRLAVSDLP